MGRSKTRTSFNTRLKREVELYWPRLTRFYGFTPDELWQMPRVVRLAYIRAMPQLEAHEQLQRIEAAQFPHLKQDTRRRVFERLSRMAQLEAEQPIKPKNREDAQRALAGMGIAVERVPA